VTSTVPSQSARREAEVAGVRMLEVQPGGPLHDWLTRGKARAALVHPDGTVMLGAATVGQAIRALDGLAVERVVPVVHTTPRR